MVIAQDRQNYGKYVLTGSRQFNFIRGLIESLAGRMGLLTLLPFIDHEHHKKLIKIKSSETFKPSMVKTMESLLMAQDQTYLLYRGEQFAYTENISILPYSKFLNEKNERDSKSCIQILSAILILSHDLLKTSYGVV